MQEKILDGFDWDDGNIAKCQKHGVTIGEIESLFRTGPFVAPDFDHSDREDRLLAVGVTETGRRVFVVFTVRDQDGQKNLIRPVSARFMHEKEYLRYAKASS